MNLSSQDFSLHRDSLSSLFNRIDGRQLQNVFEEPWFNRLVPNAAKMLGCGQGSVVHLEGDVAVHTGAVFDAIGEVAVRRLGRGADFIEKLSAVLHDCRKPATRVDNGDGSVSFPGHEALAADEVPAIAKRLRMTTEEANRLEFIVRHHGDVHGWPDLAEEVKASLRSSPYFTSLALLQEADALCCILPGGVHLAVYWDDMVLGK
jgi:hypothetical protein